jgi:polyhydroxyalkanoate synthesis regulator protein
MLSQMIRFYGDSLQGFMGGYLERSLQNFLDQSQQFRSQVSGLMGQNAWQMVNELTERNLEIWKSMQAQMLNPPTPGGKAPPPPPPRGTKK